MNAYQAGMQKFADAGAAVFGVSTDNSPSQKEFAAKLNLTFPILSDFKDRKVSETSGILNKEAGMANRVTFVIDKDGKIEFMEFGGDAVKIVGAGDACSRLAHKKAE